MDFNSMLNKMDEAKKKLALIPSEREKECKHESGFRYTGSMPCTGPQKCMLCGMTKEEAEKGKKTAKESKVNEMTEDDMFDAIRDEISSEDSLKNPKNKNVNEAEDTKWKAFGMRGPLDDYIISNAPEHRTKLAGYLDAIHVIRNNFVVYANLSEFGKYVKGALEIASIQLLKQYETGGKVKKDDDELDLETTEEELQHEIEKVEGEIEAEEESEFDEEGWKEEQDRLRTENEGIAPDFNKDGEEAQIKKLVEGVRELIGEVPGINRQDQEILNWALDNRVISPEFPEDEVMIDAMAMLDMTGDEDVDMGAAEEDVGIQAYYLKYIMLPRAKKEYAERDLVDESKVEVPDSVETFSIVSPELGNGYYWELMVNGKTHTKCKTREECYIELAKYKPEAKESMDDGLAKKANKKPEDFDRGELEAGSKVELEHTDDKTKAQQIAMDHLTEDPLYYKKLKKMEKK